MTFQEGSFFELFRPPFIRPLALAVALMAFSQFCGINAVMYYSSKIFASTGGGRDVAFTSTVWVGLVNLAFTFVAIGLVDKVGRRARKDLLGLRCREPHDLRVCRVTASRNARPNPRGDRADVARHEGGKERVRMSVLACDFGGTRMKIGVVQDGCLLAYAVEPANAQQGLATQLPGLKATWLRQLHELGLRVQDCAGISMAFASLIDRATDRVVLQQDKYADAGKFDLPKWGRTEFDLPLAIDNDARMALIGEWHHGAGRDSQNLVMMTLGTGVGTSAVIEGRLLRGCHGQAGVLGGHLTARYGGRRCTCGNVGCAEAEASTAFLDDMAADLPEWKSSPLRQADTLDYALVFEQAALGERYASFLLRRETMPR